MGFATVRFAWVTVFCVAAFPAKAEIALPGVDFVGEGTWCATGTPCSKLIIYYTPKRWRIDFGEGQYQTRYIYDLEKKTLTKVMHSPPVYSVEDWDPKRKVYVGFGFLPTTAIGERVGEEVVDGRPTSKYRVTDRELDKEGFAWVTAENIVVRMETSHVIVNERTTIKFAAGKLAIGTFDAKPLANAIPKGSKRLQP